MSRHKLILSLIAVLGLGGLCLYINRDWFAREPIHISHRVSPWLASRGRGPADTRRGNPVVFSFDKHYRFSSIKIFVAADMATNKYPHAIWDLVSESNSAPTASFVYGSRIPGMSPAVKGAWADPLEPGVKYRLVVQIGDRQAQHDFAAPPRR